METEYVYFKGHQIKNVWPPMKENRLQRMRVRKGPNPHLLSCPCPWKPFTREKWTVLRAKMRYLQSRVSVFNPPSMWNFLKHLLMSDSFDCVDSLCRNPHTKDSFGVFFPLFSYLTNFLFGILLNLERALEALMFRFWQLVVCSSDNQMLFPSATFQLWKQDSNAVALELTVATITQLCHHLRTS